VWLSRNVFITILGRSAWSPVNSYNAVLRESGFRPDVIHIFLERAYEKDLDTVVACFQILNESFDVGAEIFPETVDDVDFRTAGRRITELVGQCKQGGDTVAIDITPGRKSMVVSALIPAVRHNVDHVFYLSIDSLENASKPYMMIPLPRQQLVDFNEAGGGDAGDR